MMLGFILADNGARANEPINPALRIDNDLPLRYDTGGIITDSVIVEFESYSDARTAQTFNTLPGVDWEKAMSNRPVARYRILDGSTPFEVITRLRVFSNIREVYPNYRRSASYIPNDPFFTLQQEEFAVARIPGVWDVETGSADVLVGIIDTGVYTGHQDLLPNLVLPGINVREDQVPDIVEDDSGHGTAVAGIIGAVGNNGEGVAGIAWHVRMLPIRACGGPLLDCDLFDEVEAIDAAREANVDIINMSIGGVGTISLEQTAVTEAYNAGIVIVSAAGNGNPGKYYKSTGTWELDKHGLYFPAALPEVIGVGAVGNDGLAAEFSNYGEDILSLMAPGVDIVTTVPEDEVYLYTGDGPPYGLASGTSFATPMVTGVAALVLSHFPGLTPAEVRQRIEGTAIPMAGPDENQNGVNDYYGYGILNAVGAVTQSTSSGNYAYRLGVTTSPIFANEVLVIVQAYLQLDSPPVANWTHMESGRTGHVTLSAIQRKPGFFIGRFNPGGTGNVSINLTGFAAGAPIPPVSVLYLVSD